MGHFFPTYVHSIGQVRETIPEPVLGIFQQNASFNNILAIISKIFTLGRLFSHEMKVRLLVQLITIENLIKNDKFIYFL